jgi:hypothetical protein
VQHVDAKRRLPVRAQVPVRARCRRAPRPSGPAVLVQDQGLQIVLAERPVSLRRAVPLRARRCGGGTAARHNAPDGGEPVAAVAAPTSGVPLAADDQLLPAGPAGRRHRAAGWTLRAAAAANLGGARLVNAGRAAPFGATAAAAAGQQAPLARGSADELREQLCVLRLLVVRLAAAGADPDRVAASAGATPI